MTATTTVAPESATEWHGLTADEACRRLDVDPAVGLSAAEATQRRQQYGPNKLSRGSAGTELEGVPAPVPRSDAVGAGRRRRSSASSPCRTSPPAFVVIGLTVVNALMGLHQEGKAAESVAALRQMLIMTANVRRDGQRVQIPAEELVPGDIVGFEAATRFRRTAGSRVGDARDRRGRAHRREHAGRQGDRARQRNNDVRSATASTWRT